MPTQEEALITYLREFLQIDCWTAPIKLGITHISEIIRRIEAKGIIIDRVPERAVNRYGNRVNIVRYWFSERNRKAP